MIAQGGARRSRWRWVVCGWAVLVVTGGGLTLWLQDSAGPREPYEGRNADREAERDQHGDPAGVTLRPGVDTDCPPSPVPEATRDPGKVTLYLCARSTTDR